MQTLAVKKDFNFKALKFGYAEAQKEGSVEPSLLIKGFFDPADLIGQARSGHRFLFLGYKGSGKSAIGEHLRLMAAQDSQLFVINSALADFPFTDFGRIIRGDAEPESRFPTAWSWLLLLQLFNSFAHDEGAHPESKVSFYSALEILKKAGLIPTPGFKEVVRVSAKRSFRLAFPAVFEAGIEKHSTEATQDIPFFVDRLRLLATQFHSGSTHLLIIDGLDEILTARAIQYQSLAALISEADRLNLLFQRSSTPAKIIILCRTDLFERLPSANKNKIRRDSAVHLDWYHDPRRPSESMLIKVANLRARLVLSEIKDIFSEFFPSTIQDQEVREFLLDLTRHTPRDFLQLLNSIQSFSTGSRLTREQVLSGIRQYSIDYFLPEIRDELHGYVEWENVDLTFDLIGSMRKRDFEFEEILAKASESSRFGKLDLPSIIGALFECSALGNVHHEKARRITYYTFKFRNRNSTLNLQDRLILHRGMWKAMNLV